MQVIAPCILGKSNFEKENIKPLLYVTSGGTKRGGWIRLIVGFQSLMVISPTTSWIRWCMQVYVCGLIWTRFVWAERSTPDTSNLIGLCDPILCKWPVQIIVILDSNWHVGPIPCVHKATSSSGDRQRFVTMLHTWSWIPGTFLTGSGRDLLAGCAPLMEQPHPGPWLVALGSNYKHCFHHEVYAINGN